MLAEYHPLCIKRAILSSGPQRTTTFVLVSIKDRHFAQGDHLHVLTFIRKPAGLHLEVLGKARGTGVFLTGPGGMLLAKDRAPEN